MICFWDQDLHTGFFQLNYIADFNRERLRLREAESQNSWTILYVFVYVMF